MISETLQEFELYHVLSIVSPKGYVVRITHVADGFAIYANPCICSGTVQGLLLLQGHGGEPRGIVGMSFYTVDSERTQPSNND